MQPLNPRSPQLRQRQRQLPGPTHWGIPVSFLVAAALVSNLQPAIAHPGHGALDPWLNPVLTPHFRVVGLGVAFLFGMAHAVSPGHGKTMVVAYLVGTRGTPKDAVLLGLITTLTHTLGIFLLGLGVLFATNYVLPAQLYPILSFLSGLLVFGVGFWLLDQRLQAMQSSSAPQSAQLHPHPHGS
ncbi:HoxN/HupN/NixA family nickel/cobalt transporter, partial [Trichothermofontia sp.]